MIYMKIFGYTVMAVIGIAISVFIMIKLLDKSNNFGDEKPTEEHFAKGGFIYVNKMDGLNYVPRLDGITNPNVCGTGLMDSNAKRDAVNIEKEIEKTDLSNVKWHT